MTGALDPKNDLSYLDFTSKSQSNNTGALIGDLTGFIGKVNVRVQIGVKTAGDSDGAISISAFTSATNNISNATNAGGAGTVSTSNNASTAGSISVDTRAAAGKFLFLVPTVTGTNSPAFPLAATVIGTKQIQ